VRVAELLPLFPLNLVAFPGMTVPLHIFEERYRALVRALLEEPDRKRRLFGIVAIREGYEVGQHEARSMFRTGCVMQLLSADEHPDGRFDIAAVGRHRMRVLGTDTGAPFLRAEVEPLDTDHPAGRGRGAEETAREAALALSSFAEYRSRVLQLHGDDVVSGRLPRDPELLSYALAGGCPLPLHQRQQLLESSTTRERLMLLRRMLRDELRAMAVIPSLPATDVARSGWNPN
jgi:Lon protease-like protein